MKNILTFKQLIEKNKEELIKDEQAVEKIERKLENKYINHNND